MPPPAGLTERATARNEGPGTGAGGDGSGFAALAGMHLGLRGGGEVAAADLRAMIPEAASVARWTRARRFGAVVVLEGGASDALSQSDPAVPAILEGLFRWPAPARSRRLLSVTLPQAVIARLNDRGWETPELVARAAAGLRLVRAQRLGGACWLPDRPTPPDGPAAVLVDLPADPGLARRMLDIAAREHAAERIVAVRTAPAGPVPFPWPETSGMRYRIVATNPWVLLDGASRVLTAGGELGWLALIAGRPVECFGTPFFAGWGLTRDHDPVATRLSRSLEAVFAATCLLNARYLDPFTRAPWRFEDAAAHQALRLECERENAGVAVCLGMSFWKRRVMADFFRSVQGAPRFAKDGDQALATARRRGGAVAVWATRVPPGFEAKAAAARVPVLRVEDGFLRSVGLGSDFTRAASLVVDPVGIYYDPAAPSRLEQLLVQAPFPPDLRDRAARLIEQLVARAVTKYNTGAPAPPLDLPAARRVMLVPGQVEDDRSVQLGGAGIHRNIDLLAAVRARAPDAFLLYKPHPDVDAGHRQGQVADADALVHADRVVRDVAVPALLAQVHEVHTLTSLMGFEALLRGRAVTTYGQPFYAGWGLTDDANPPPRRDRPLTLEDLVAATLILYPRYLDPLTRQPCGPEVIVDRLAMGAALWSPSLLVRLRRLQGVARRVLGLPRD